MANPNAPFGFELVNTAGREIVHKYFPKASGSAIYPGDCVVQLAAGTVQVMTAADTNKFVGVAAEYRAATDTTPIPVITDIDAEFRVQSAGTPAAADNFQNVDIVATAGDSTLKKSKMAVSGTTATTATLPFKIVGLDVRGSNAYAQYAVLIVKVNESAFRAGTAGV